MHRIENERKQELLRVITETLRVAYYFVCNSDGTAGYGRDPVKAHCCTRMTTRLYETAAGDYGRRLRRRRRRVYVTRFRRRARCTFRCGGVSRRGAHVRRTPVYYCVNEIRVHVYVNAFVYKCVRVLWRGGHHL